MAHSGSLAPRSCPPCVQPATSQVVLMTHAYLCKDVSSLGRSYSVRLTKRLHHAIAHEHLTVLQDSNSKYIIRAMINLKLSRLLQLEKVPARQASMKTPHLACSWRWKFHMTVRTTRSTTRRSLACTPPHHCRAQQMSLACSMQSIRATMAMVGYM